MESKKPVSLIVNDLIAFITADLIISDAVIHDIVNDLAIKNSPAREVFSQLGNPNIFRMNGLLLQLIYKALVTDLLTWKPFIRNGPTRKWHSEIHPRIY